MNIMGSCVSFKIKVQILAFFTDVPPKILSPFLSTAPLQYVPKIRFTQATTDSLINNKTKNGLHNEAVILNYISGGPKSHSLSN